MSAPWLTLAALLFAQAVAGPPATATGALAGVVLEADTGAPVSGATLYAIGPATRRQTIARTRLGGQWRLSGLPQGVYRVVAVAPGFAPAWVEPAQRAQPPDGDAALVHQLSLDPGQERDGLVARLDRAGSISGRVTTPAGVPVPDVVVTIDGAPALGVPRLGQALTDREGRYRLDAVAPGERLVTVLPNRMPSSRAPDRGWSKVFHPGTTRRDRARTVRVRAGEHLGDVDVIVSLPASHVITGQLVAPAGAGDVHVRLLSNGGRTLRNLTYEPGIGLIGPDIVDGGRYLLWASGRDGGRALAGWQAQDIAGDGDLASLSLVQTGEIRGRILSAAGALVPSANLAVGSVLWMDGEGFEIVGERDARVSADGEFELGGILGPRRLYVRGLPPGWEVLDVRVSDTSVLAAGLDVGPAEAIDGVVIVAGPGR